MRDMQRQNPVLQDWEVHLRGDPLWLDMNFSEYSEMDIREITEALVHLDDENHKLYPMLPSDFFKARRIRSLTLQSLKKGNIGRARRLIGGVFRPLADCLRRDDMRLAEKASASQMGSAKGGAISKKRAWAVELAALVVAHNPTGSLDEGWESISEDGETFSAGGVNWDVYRDIDTLTAHGKGQFIQTLTKNTFNKSYLSPARKIAKKDK